MTDDVVVKVNGLGKRFKLYDAPVDRLKEWVSIGRKTHHKDFWALKDISFEVRKGECFGIIGENGAGKSTILKILTGAMSATEGDVAIKGRTLSLLELGTGFNPELTGRLNVYNSANLLGFPEDYLTDERVKGIEEFADIGEYFDQPVKTYSSGMFVRLAFSMFMFMEPDVFIIDEALSVGDIFFSQKCFAKIREFKEKGVTFIFVSHDLAAVQNLSDRVMILNRGHQAFIGAPEQAVSRYYGMLRKPAKPSAEKVEGKREPTVTANPQLMDPNEIIAHSILTGKSRHGEGGLEIAAARVTDKNGMDTMSVPMMGELRFYFLIRANRDIKTPHVGVGFYDRMSNLIFSLTTAHLGVRLDSLPSGGQAVVGLKVRMTMQTGQYIFHLACGELKNEDDFESGVRHDIHDLLGPLSVFLDSSMNPPPFNGMAYLPTEVLSLAYEMNKDGK